LREYLYFPLGGNRLGTARTYINLIVVMLLGGLWHGAAWSYMVWGGAHGLFLAIERFFGVKGEVVQATRNASSTGASPLNSFTFQVSSFTLRLLRILLIFNVVSFLWLLFQLPNFSEAILYMKELAAWKTGIAPQPIFAILFFSTPVVLFHIWGAIRKTVTDALVINHSPLLRMGSNLAYAVLLFLIATNSGSPGAFIYFQF
jgi:alginate O-acetyltransferase complex protein AlgI